jgi:hypothetical protein
LQYVNEEETPFEANVFQVIGAASTCWTNMEGAGIFDDAMAAQIGEGLLEVFESYARSRVGMCWDVE